MRETERVREIEREREGGERVYYQENTYIMPYRTVPTSIRRPTDDPPRIATIFGKVLLVFAG